MTDRAPLDDFAGDVLDTVEAIPPGHVMSYGDVAEYLGRGGPRQVGRVLATSGGAVPWWRVIHADGSLLAGHEPAALAHYRAEGTPLRPSAGGAPARVDMRRARWHGPTAGLALRLLRGQELQRAGKRTTFAWSPPCQSLLAPEPHWPGACHS